MTEISARTRNLILILAGMAGVGVVYGYITGAEWLQFVSQMIGGVLKGLV